MSWTAHIDWLALGVGTVGTLLWAHNGKSARFAAIWWLASSLLWVTFAYFSGLEALGARDALSVALYLYGGYRWLKPERPSTEVSNSSASIESAT